MLTLVRGNAIGDIPIVDRAWSACEDACSVMEEVRQRMESEM
jgi:hypothetical protein